MLGFVEMDARTSLESRASLGRFGRATLRHLDLQENVARVISRIAKPANVVRTAPVVTPHCFTFSCLLCVAVNW